MNASTRLQKFLSEQGICSRRAGEDLIRAGKIVIDDRVAVLGDKVSGSEAILINGKKLKVKDNIKRIVLAWHKPVGVEVTLQTSDNNKTLADYDFGVGRVFPIGRLDKDSRGLLLLTNDGELANLMMHPRYEKEKVYQVRVDKPFNSTFVKRMSQGVMFAPGKKSSPCKVEAITKNQFEITLSEGANRQIRRMCSSLGFTVTDLLRTRFGLIQLKRLKSSSWLDVSDQFSEVVT